MNLVKFVIPIMVSHWLVSANGKCITMQQGNCDTDAQCRNGVCREPGNIKGHKSSQKKCYDCHCAMKSQCYLVDKDMLCNCTGSGFGGEFCKTDTDECLTGAHGCDMNARCTNTEGSFQCTCNEGFTGDGISCTDIDECLTCADNCDANAACTNTEGSFQCVCNKGYSGDGSSCPGCLDIDECSAGAHTCDQNAECTNTDGSYQCTCKKGFIGDGVNCSVMSCPDGWVRYNSSCYIFGQSQHSMPESSYLCHAMGSELVEIDSAEENEFISTTIQSKDLKYTPFWTGLTDLQEIGIWKFFGSKQIPQYTNWAPNEPSTSNYFSQCITLKGSLWHSDLCFSRTLYICELRLC